MKPVHKEGLNYFHYGWDFAVLFMLVAVLALDILTPLGQIVWILYVAVAGLSLFARGLKTVWAVLVFGTVFLAIGYVVSPQWGIDRSFLLNRLLGAVTLWLVSFAVIRSKLFEAKNKKEMSLRSLENGLAIVMATELELEDLAEASLNFLLAEAGGLVGAFYILEERQTLRLVHSVGGTAVPSHFPVGEGLVGRQALEKKFTHITNLPKDYIAITSASGSTSAVHALLIPLCYSKNIRGVVEIASLKPFSEKILDFAERAQDMLGQGLTSALYARELRKAFEEKSNQAEELQAQQEELRVTNEELEAQSSALRESQAQLETQASELEQQQILMEEKNEELKTRNMELQRTKAELEEGTRELAEASRYKSEFLSNMSHELRTPINSILILSQLLAENKDKTLGEEQVEFAQTIASSGNDLLNLINEILDLSKVEAGMMDLHVETVYAKDVLDRMRRFFTPFAEEKGLKLIVENELEASKVLKTDSKRLEQILKNLLSNAIKFTSQGTVTLRAYELESGRIQFSVRDTGTGIAKAKQKTIFRAFEQGDGTIARRYGGTGLGLSIVKELTHLLQGTIDLSSEEGKGSLFCLTLPDAIQATTAADRAVELSAPASLSPSTGRASTAMQARSSSSVPELGRAPKQKAAFEDDSATISDKDRTVVIIEDDPVFSKTLLKIAREMDFKGVCAFTGEDGIDAVERFKPAAVLLDMRLPDTNGLTVLEHIKASPVLRHIPVHVVSAVSYEQNALAMGAVGYLQKPTSAAEIRGAFSRVSEIISKDIKYVLIVEDDPIQRMALEKLVASPEVKVLAVGEVKGAMQVLKEQVLDCMIMDLRLPDGSGLQLLEQMSEMEGLQKPPVIVYTGKDLTRIEETQLKKYSESIIIKGARSPERLLAETSLFLHRVERDLPQDKQKMLREVRERSDSLKGKTILLVDDDVRNVFALSAALEGQGLKVIAARNGREAIEKLHANDDIQTVLMDIMMPEMDGFEATRKIREERRYANLPIIAITAKAMRGDDIRCLEAGANDYLSKPVDLDKLLSLLRVWLSSVGGF